MEKNDRVILGKLIDGEPFTFAAVRALPKSIWQIVDFNSLTAAGRGVYNICKNYTDTGSSIIFDTDDFVAAVKRAKAISI